MGQTTEASFTVLADQRYSLVNTRNHQSKVSPIGQASRASVSPVRHVGQVAHEARRVVPRRARHGAGRLLHVRERALVLPAVHQPARQHELVHLRGTGASVHVQPARGRGPTRTYGGLWNMYEFSYCWFFGEGKHRAEPCTRPKNKFDGVCECG